MIKDKSDTANPNETRPGSSPYGHYYRLGYRPDIEGLRALAILLVVAHHAGLPWLTGGFIGVDVFFVLSGYLITGLLLREIGATGRVNLLEFYARRLRRLLPALLFMVTGTVVAGSLLLAPLEQLPQADTARAASLWITNFFLAFTDFGYFAPAANSDLFLHTWSLGVEEQFYLVWPLLLMFLLGAWQWQGAAGDMTRLRHGLMAVIGLSLGLAIFLSFTNPIWGFYLAPARGWQFALGAIAFLWSDRRAATASNSVNSLSFSDRSRTALLAFLGVALILLSAVFLRKEVSYPGAWALMPSIGAALVLGAGSVAQTAVTRWLSITPMQAIGRVSYSWYLWHWPILVLGGSVVIADSVVGRVALVAFSLAIAVVSYFLVESPIRRNNVLAKRPRLTLAAAGSLMGLAVVGSLAWQQVATSWAERPNQRQYQEVRGDVPIIYAMGCDEWFYSAQVRVCAFGDEKAQKTAVLIDDSIVGQWFPAVAEAYNKPGWRLLVLTKSSCPMVDESFFYQRIAMQHTVCDQWRNQAVAFLRSIKPDVLLMGEASTYGFSRDQWVSGTTRILSQLAPATPNVFVVLGTYSLPFDGPGCLARRHWRSSALAGAEDCSAPGESRTHADIKMWINEAAASFQNVTVWDPNPLICPNGRCAAELGGQIVFRDSQHLTGSFVKSLGKEFARAVGQEKRL